MNYLVACDGLFPDNPSGSARVAWDIAMAMRDRGHQVGFVCKHPWVGRERSDTEVIDGIVVVRYRYSKGDWVRPLWRRGVARAAMPLLRDRCWDCAHVHTPMTGQSVAALMPTQTRIVYTVHSPVVLEQQFNWARQGWQGTAKSTIGLPIVRRMEASLLQRCHALHTLSKYTHEQLEACHHQRLHAHVIPHWCRDGDTRSVSRAEARARLGWPMDRAVWFTLRRHVARMGIDVAIKAAAPLARDGRCMLVIGGDGPLRGELERLAISLGCDGTKIPFTGRLNEADLKLAYQAADLFILPTLALECFGLIVIEAMGFGCPVLGTSVGAIPELIEPLDPALLVPPDRDDLLRAKLESILAGTLQLPSEDRLTQYVNSRFSHQFVVSRLSQLLEQPSLHKPGDIMAT